MYQPDGLGALYPIRPKNFEPLNAWFSNANLQPLLKLKPEKGPPGRWSNPDRHLYNLLIWRR
jgi:hypothetical protein